jgi:hypothetical protein
MNKSKFLLVSSALLFASFARAQLNIPVADITLAYPSISSVDLELGTTNHNGVRPTPFLINNALVEDSLVWFCLDPLQVIYIASSGLPNGSKLHYASDDPSDFNKWNSGAPGLNATRIQDLADLFTAYMPATLAGNQTLIGALQVAVWEIVNEFDGYGYHVGSGKMEVHANNAADNALITAAQNMLNSINTAPVQNLGDITRLSYLIDGTYTDKNCDVVKVQDLLGWTPPEFTPPIPESGSFALGAVAILLPLALWRVRSRKSKTA